MQSKRAKKWDVTEQITTVCLVQFVRMSALNGYFFDNGCSPLSARFAIFLAAKGRAHAVAHTIATAYVWLVPCLNWNTARKAGKTKLNPIRIKAV